MRLSLRGAAAKDDLIIVPRSWDGQRGYLVESNDQGEICINPCKDDKTLIKTTDIPHAGPAGDAEISAVEIDYLSGVVNRSFKEEFRRGAVPVSLPGMRRCVDDDSSSPSAGIYAHETLDELIQGVPPTDRLVLVLRQFAR